jgi:lipoprotein-anchoring transpeptidase ErfK/SrfK
MMKNIFIVLFTIFSQTALADVFIDINKSRQTMSVYQDGQLMDVWPVSTARKGYYTPTGSFYPYSLQTMHYSKKYDNAPMPHSIFFSGGYAIHATPHISNLGRPASHGCVRLSPTNASILYEVVKSNRNNTTIRIN